VLDRCTSAQNNSRSRAASDCRLPVKNRLGSPDFATNSLTRRDFPTCRRPRTTTSRPAPVCLTARDSPWPVLGGVLDPACRSRKAPRWVSKRSGVGAHRQRRVKTTGVAFRVRLHQGLNAFCLVGVRLPMTGRGINVVCECENFGSSNSSGRTVSRVESCFP
jgi:hypothetical protein